jgi:hypothetical protein
MLNNCLASKSHRGRRAGQIQNGVVQAPGRSYLFPLRRSRQGKPAQQTPGLQLLRLRAVRGTKLTNV